MNIKKCFFTILFLFIFSLASAQGPNANTNVQLAHDPDDANKVYVSFDGGTFQVFDTSPQTAVLADFAASETALRSYSPDLLNQWLDGTAQWYDDTTTAFDANSLLAASPAKLVGFNTTATVANMPEGHVTGMLGFISVSGNDTTGSAFAFISEHVSTTGVGIWQRDFSAGVWGGWEKFSPDSWINTDSIVGTLAVITGSRVILADGKDISLSILNPTDVRGIRIVPRTDWANTNPLQNGASTAGWTIEPVPADGTQEIVVVPNHTTSTWEVKKVGVDEVNYLPLPTDGSAVVGEIYRAVAPQNADDVVEGAEYLVRTNDVNVPAVMTSAFWNTQIDVIAPNVPNGTDVRTLTGAGTQGLSLDSITGKEYVWHTIPDGLSQNYTLVNAPSFVTVFDDFTAGQTVAASRVDNVSSVDFTVAGGNDMLMTRDGNALKLTFRPSEGSASLRGLPVADNTALTGLVAKDFETRLVKSTGSTYLFKLTADLTPTEDADANNLADDLATGKWVLISDPLTGTAVERLVIQANRGSIMTFGDLQFRVPSSGVSSLQFRYVGGGTAAIQNFTTKWSNQQGGASENGFNFAIGSGWVYFRLNGGLNLTQHNSYQDATFVYDGWLYHVQVIVGLSWTNNRFSYTRWKLEGVKGDAGVDGIDGIDGSSVDHVSQTAGDSTPGTSNTYTLWADVGETANLGTFDVPIPTPADASLPLEDLIAVGSTVEQGNDETVTLSNSKTWNDLVADGYEKVFISAKEGSWGNYTISGYFHLADMINSGRLMVWINSTGSQRYEIVLDNITGSGTTFQVENSNGSHVDFKMWGVRAQKELAVITPGDLLITNPNDAGVLESNQDGTATFNTTAAIPLIQRGSISAGGASNEQISITFPQAFAGAPTVIPTLLINGAAADTAVVNLWTVNATGATFILDGAWATNDAIHWIAVGDAP